MRIAYSVVADVVDVPEASVYADADSGGGGRDSPHPRREQVSYLLLTASSRLNY